MPLPPEMPEWDRWADDTHRQRAEVAMDSAMWWAPTSVDEEYDNGGTTTANAPVGRGGTRHPAPMCTGQAGDTDDSGPSTAYT